MGGGEVSVCTVYTVYSTIFVTINFCAKTSKSLYQVYLVKAFTGFSCIHTECTIQAEEEAYKILYSKEEGRGQCIHCRPLNIYSRMSSAAFSPVQHSPLPL